MNAEGGRRAAIPLIRQPLEFLKFLLSLFPIWNSDDRFLARCGRHRHSDDGLQTRPTGHLEPATASFIRADVTYVLTRPDHGLRTTD